MNLDGNKYCCRKGRNLNLAFFNNIDLRISIQINVVLHLYYFYWCSIC